MGERYLIDSNVVIDFSLNRFNKKSKEFIAKIIDEESNISFVNKIELLGFSTIEPEIIEFIDKSSVLGIDDDIIIQTISIRKAHKIKLPDAIIAATAIEEGLILITNNSSDFKKIKGLKCINPYELK